MGLPALAIVRSIGRYSTFDEIASAGMTTVCLGRLAGTGGFVRTVAIKRLHPHLHAAHEARDERVGADFRARSMHLELTW
jgi:hypothetical protein